MTRWSLMVSDNLDHRLRAYLGQHAAKKGSLSRFVEEAVDRRLRFEETVEGVQKRNLQYDMSQIEADIDEAVRATRASHRP